MSARVTEALKPCPFCGGEAQRIELGPDDGFGNEGGDVICCTRCQASSHVEFGRKENLVSAWNRRHREQATAELVEALRPFAEAAADLDDETRDSCSMWEHHVSVNVTAGDFRRAAEVLSRHTEPTDAELVDDICRASAEAMKPLGEVGRG